MATLTGSDILAKSLVTQGMDTLFYIMGGPMIETEAAIIKLGARAIDTRHEQAASLMAHAYSRITRKPGVCMGASGPGATNLVTPIADAYMDSVPIVAITGQVASAAIGTDAFQEADIRGITMPITKHNFLVTDPAEIPRTVAEAFYLASHAYAPEQERGIRWNDPRFDIEWPIEPTVISDKDRSYRDFDPAWHLA